MGHCHEILNDLPDIQVKDEEGRLMNDFTGRIKRDEWAPPAGFQRTLTVAMDTAQYQLDMEHMQEHQSEDVYSSFNLLMRRKPKVSHPLMLCICSLALNLEGSCEAGISCERENASC